MDRVCGNGKRMRKWRENGEIKRKWREYEEIERKWRESEEMDRKWGNGVRDRMRERKNFISVFPSLCCKTLKFLTFCHKTLKYVTFCREMLKYGTFCRECRKNRNIRAMRKWFWIKSGCEEAPQVVPAWGWGWLYQEILPPRHYFPIHSRGSRKCVGLYDLCSTAV